MGNDNGQPPIEEAYDTGDEIVIRGQAAIDDAYPQARYGAAVAVCGR